MQNLKDKVAATKAASHILATATDEERKAMLFAFAHALEVNAPKLYFENSKDLDDARQAQISDVILHRLLLSPDKLSSAVKGLRSLASLPDPVGKVREKRLLDTGFLLEKVAFPMGLIGMVFEARPDAMIQIIGLCIRTGNGIVLKGGKEALHSNRAIAAIAKESMAGAEWIQLIESHAEVDEMLSLDNYIDLLIPRGSNSFVRYVMDHTHIPVLGHADGICAVYVDKGADLTKAYDIVFDSKTQYPAACNAAETLLVHESVAKAFLPEMKRRFDIAHVILHGDERVQKIISCIPALEEDFHTEYLNLEMAVKVVDSLDEAIAHIQSHGSHHTDAIITEDEKAKQKFFLEVDSADVFANCSTRFSDGFRFGLGAEVGISTSKIHARGPVGLEGLMTTKWLLSGHGEVVATYTGSHARPFLHEELDTNA